VPPRPSHRWSPISSATRLRIASCDPPRWRNSASGLDLISDSADGIAPPVRGCVWEVPVEVLHPVNGAPESPEAEEVAGADVLAWRHVHRYERLSVRADLPDEVRRGRHFRGDHVFRVSLDLQCRTPVSQAFNEKKPADPSEHDIFLRVVLDCTPAIELTGHTESPCLAIRRVQRT
jgi:hypothetical protein